VNERQIEDYVDAACVLQDLALGPEERARVIAQFGRIAAIAAPLLAVELPPEIELAPVFRP
jgi:hypothetical protein